MSNCAQKLEVIVAGDEGSVRLDRVLAARLEELSRSRLKALILAGSVAVGNAPVRDPAHHVAKGDMITIEVPEAVPAEPKGEDIALDIVDEDDDLIVINKPKGLVVHPAAGHEFGTLVNALIAHCGASLSGIGGVRRPGIVHRLDKDTTGLMVVAKNDRAHQSLTAQFADHGRTGPMQRGYMAFAWACRTASAAPSTRRSTATRTPARRWRSAKAAARPSPIGKSRRLIQDATTSRSPRFSPANSKPGGPTRSGCICPDRPPPAGRCRLWFALQDQGRSPRPGGTGRPRRPRAAGVTRLPPGPGTSPDRGAFALGGGPAGGFASTQERAGSGAMTQRP